MRAEELIGQLTMEEKISLLSETAPAVERLGIRRYHHGNEALHGVVRPGKFTVFPQAIGMGACFHPELVQEVAEAISDEARARHNENHGEMTGGDFDGLYNGLLTFWSPNLNTARDPRWGRTGETYGEDPFLTGVCGTAFIKGLQGEGEVLKTVATPKHFVGNNEEHNRFECNAEIPREQYFDYYLKPFETAVKEGKCESIMAAYNAVDGTPCHANYELLTDILRERWGFKGYTVSDCGAVSHLIDRHKYVGTPREAAAAALKAGVDLECGSCGAIQQVYRNYLGQAYEEGLIEAADIDRAVRRVLTAREKLGILGKESQAFDYLTEEIIGCQKHQNLALQMAEESLVLLKNDFVKGKPILPLKENVTICVVGNQADKCQFGDYSGTPVNQPVTILEGLREVYTESQIHYIPYEKEQVTEKFQIVEGAWFFHDEEGERKPGIQGQYDSLKNKETTCTRTDERIAFEWENMAPDPLIQRKLFKIKWSGILLPTESGNYQFKVKANEKECPCKGRNSLYIDGVLVNQNELFLEAGKEYAIVLEYENIGNRPSVNLFWKKSGGGKAARFQREIEAAKKCDVVLACVGLGTEYEAEGRDKTDLNLPREQMELLKAVHNANPNLLVTLYNGSSLTIPWISEHAKGILECWYPGEQGGKAIANVISGKTNPSGRIPLTFYRDVENLPSFQCYDISKGFTYWYATDVIYPFGYGLGYSTFEYSGFHMEPKELGLIGTVRVKNEGNMAGYEVIQVYAKNLEGDRNPNKLVEVKKIWLEPKQEKMVELCVPDSRLESYICCDDKCSVKDGLYVFSVARDALHMIIAEERVREGARWRK